MHSLEILSEAPMQASKRKLISLVTRHIITILFEGLFGNRKYTTLASSAKCTA